MTPATIVLTDRLDQLLAPPRELSVELATLFQSLFERQYTGPLTIHFKAGQAKVAEFPAPKIKLG